MEETGLQTWGLKAPGVGEEQPTRQSLWHRKECGRAGAGTLEQRNVFLGRESKAIVRAHTVFVRKLMHSCPIVSAGDLLWAHPSYPPSGRGQGASSQAVGGWTAEGERSLVGAPRSPRGKEARAGPCRPRGALSAARLVAWDATLWGGKEGADGGTLGPSSCAGGE